MRWKTAALLPVIVFATAASAGDAASYRVTAVIEDAEKFLVEGPGGTFTCEAMTYCFGLDEGDQVLFLKDPDLYTNDEVVYGDRTCSLWDCDRVSATQSSASMKIAPSAATSEAQLKALLAEYLASRGATVPTSASASSSECSEAGVKEPNPVLGNSGEIIVLSDGGVWKVAVGEYNYLYEYNATVRVCDDKLIIADKAISVTRVR